MKPAVEDQRLNVADFVDPRRVIKLTAEMIRIPSGTFEEMELARFLSAYMTGLGLDVELQNVPGPDSTGGQVVATLPGRGGGRSLLLCGHLDTWAARRSSIWAKPNSAGSEWTFFRPNEWTKPPFGGDVEEGWIYGVGALDQKGGIAAMVAAVEALVRSSTNLSGDVIVAAVAAEGAGGQGAKQLMADGFKADMAILTEFTNLDIVTVSTGGILGCLTVQGDPKLFPPRVDPIAKMIRVLTKLGPTDDPLPQDGWLTFTEDPDLPGYPRLAIREITTTLGSCSARFDLRTVPGVTEDTLRKDLERICGDMRAADPDLCLSIEVPVPPFSSWPAVQATDLNGTLVSALSRWHEEVVQKAPRYGSGSRLGAVSDKGHLHLGGIPEVVEYGPGLGEPWPMVDERCRVDDIVNAARVIALTAAEVCA